MFSNISDARSDFLKDMGDVISFGVDTVGYTYLVYTIVNNLVPERDLQKCITKIDASKTKLCFHHKAKLTEQMDHVLDELAVGARPICLAVTWKDGRRRERRRSRLVQLPLPVTLRCRIGIWKPMLLPKGVGSVTV